MKKNTLLLFALALTANVLFTQNLTTGELSILSTNTVKFDVNTTTNVVTMTMVFPENQWFGVSMANDGIALNEGMGEANDDVIVGSNTGIEDRYMLGFTVEPQPDSQDNWSEASNSVSGGVRTIVATRNRDTGDVQDFVFPNLAGQLPMLFAGGNTATISKHSPQDRGFFMASLFEEILSTNDLKNITLNLFPNPVSSILKINAHTQILNDLSIEIYNVLGEQVLSKKLSENDAQISVSNWSNGVYVMKIASTNNQSIIKRFIKI